MDVLAFPGQGSQCMGMGKSLAQNFSQAERVFAEVDDALSQNLSQLMFEGPLDELNLTVNTQPGLMAVSIALIRVLENEFGLSFDTKNMCAVIGHSLGEYTALTAAGSLTLAEAARLLRTRGQAMQQAVPVGVGAMAAILGVDLKTAEDLAKHAAQDQICSVANDNSNSQIVLSGHAEAIARAIANAKDFGASKAVLLNVSAPFHCELMESAAKAMASALDRLDILTPVVPVMANVTAACVTEPLEIKKLLVQQVTGRVRFRHSIQNLKAMGATRVIEIGPGKVLTGLVKRTEPDLTLLNIEPHFDGHQLSNHF